jgi:hypothetical protein
MTFKSSLFSGVAVFAAMALSAGTADAAAAKHHAKAKPHAAAPAAASAAEVEALKAQVNALQAKLEALTTQQAEIKEATAEQEAIQTTLVNSSVAQSNALNAMPTEVKKDVLANLPKSKTVWAESTSVTGRMYFDFSHIEQKTNGVKVPVSGDGFDIKRFYVGVDHKFNDIFSANVTMDARYQSTTNDVQWYVKKAYLQAKINDQLTVRAGSADMPWIPFVEDLYGYRYIDKTLTENRFTFANSADWGIHAFGKVGPYVSYAVAVVDGAGYRNPSRTAGLDVEGRISAKVGDVTVAVGGYSGKVGKDTQGATNVFNTADRFDAVVAYTTPKVRLGLEYFSANNWNSVTTQFVAPYTNKLTGDHSEGFSAFGSYQFTPVISVFGKYEYVEPNNKTLAPYAYKKDHFFNIGVNFEPVKIVDLALVYKRASTSGNNAPTLTPIAATYDELGLFGQFRW